MQQSMVLLPAGGGSRSSLPAQFLRLAAGRDWPQEALAGPVSAGGCSQRRHCWASQAATARAVAVVVVHGGTAMRLGVLGRRLPVGTCAELAAVSQQFDGRPQLIWREDVKEGRHGGGSCHTPPKGAKRCLLTIRLSA